METFKLREHWRTSRLVGIWPRGRTPTTNGDVFTETPFGRGEPIALEVGLRTRTKCRRQESIMNAEESLYKGV